MNLSRNLLIGAGSLALITTPAIAQYDVAVQADNPIGYWRLDETSGTNAANLGTAGVSGDLTYQNFPPGTLNVPGAIAGNASVTLGRVGADAASGSPSTHPNIAAGNPADFAFANGQSFSVEYFIRAAPGNASTANAGIFVKGYDETQVTPWYLGRYNNGAVDFFVRTGANNSFVAAAAHGVGDNQWHHVVNVYDAPNNTLNIYVDGTLDGSVGGVIPDTFGTNARPFTLGNHLNRALDAGLDEVAIYDQALSPAQVANHYAASGLTTTTGTRTPVLAVDFGSSSGAGGGPGGTQAGFTAMEAAEGGGNPDVSSLISGVDVTIGGYTHFRDYAAVSATYDLDELSSDMVLRNSAGTLTLTLDGLAIGDYEIRTYHVSTQFGGGTFDVNLTDSNGASAFGTAFPIARSGELSFLDIPFSANGADPVSFDFVGGAGPQHLSLNGFDVIVIPEPSSSLLVLAGIIALMAMRRPRR